jgi:hypothetical protein
MGEGPSEPGCRAGLQTAFELRRSRAGVVSVEGNVATRSRQVRSEKTNESEPSMTCRELSPQRRNRGARLTRDEAQRESAYWLGGARHKDGVSSDQALVRNVRTCRPDVKRRAQVEGLRKGASIDAGHWGGVARSSVENAEMRRSEGATLSCWARRSTALRGRSR